MVDKSHKKNTIKSNLKLTALLVHLLIFLLTTIFTWQTQGPNVMPHEIIMWCGGYGLFLWQLFPFSLSVQWIIYGVAIVVFIITTIQIINENKALYLLILWNTTLAFLYLFPFLVSRFGEYIGP